MFTDRRLGYALVFCMCLLSCSCANQVSGHTVDVQPISCHREMLVNLFFIRIENHGRDAGPSMTSVQYNTDTSTMPHVQLTLNTPPVPANSEILLTFALPYDRRTNHLLVPSGTIRIALDEKKKLPDVQRQRTILLTACNDLL